MYVRTYMYVCIFVCINAGTRVRNLSFLGKIYVARNEHVGQVGAGEVACVWTLWYQSPHDARQLFGSFVDYMRFSVPERQ